MPNSSKPSGELDQSWTMPSFSELPPNADRNRIFTPASTRAVAPDPHIEDNEDFIPLTQHPVQATRRTAPHIEDQPSDPWSTAVNFQRDIQRGNAVTPPEPPIAALSTYHPRFRTRRQVPAGRDISNLSGYPATTTAHEDWAPPPIGYGMPQTLTASQFNAPVESEHQLPPLSPISASNYAAMVRLHTSRTSPVIGNGIAQTRPLTTSDAMSQLPLAPIPETSTRSQELLREAARVRSQYYEEFTREAARVRSRDHEQATHHHLSAFTNSGVPTSHRSRDLSAMRPMIPSARMRSEVNAHVESQPGTTPPALTRFQEFVQEDARSRARQELAHRMSAFDDSDTPPSHGNQTSSALRPMAPSERTRRRPITQEGSQRPPRPPLRRLAIGSLADPPSHGTRALPTVGPVVTPTGMSPEEVGRLRDRRRLHLPPLRHLSDFATQDIRALRARRDAIPPSRMTPDDAARNRNLLRPAHLRPDNSNIPTSNERQPPLSHATRQEHRELQTTTRAFEALEQHAQATDPQRSTASLRSRIAADLAALNNQHSAFESPMQRMGATAGLQQGRLAPSMRDPEFYPADLPSHYYPGLPYTTSQLTTFIDSLPEVPLSELDEQKKDCPCCYCTYEVEANVDYGTPEKAVRLPCAYGKCVIGKRCLKVHLGNTRAGKCPLCRRQLEIVNGRSDGIAGIGGRGEMGRRGGVSRRGGVGGRGGSAAGARPSPCRCGARSHALLHAYEEGRASPEEEDDDEPFDEDDDAPFDEDMLDL